MEEHVRKIEKSRLDKNSRTSKPGQELDSIFHDFQMSHDIPLPNDFQIPDNFEVNDLLGTSDFAERPSQEKVMGEVRARDWKSRYAKLKDDPSKYEAYLEMKRQHGDWKLRYAQLKEEPVKYEAYLVKKREQAKARKLELQRGGDPEITSKMHARKLKQREYQRKYMQRILENPETHQRHLVKERAWHKKRKERREASKQS